MHFTKIIFSIAAICLFLTTANAQPITESTETESKVKVIDGVVEKTTIKETPPLKYDDIREADLFWEKKIWRVIDIREKMNLPFANPESPLIKIILDAVEAGEATAYMPGLENEFEQTYSKDEVSTIGYSIDTSIITDPVTFKDKIVITRNEFNPEDVNRFRVKEVWFFDEETSTMQVRILGISPLRNVYDDKGNFKFEQPMFWVYYPELRKVLASQPAFNPQNDATRMSWEDIFEMRYFSSYIIKESNVYDRRIKDYMTGVDGLLEAEKIKNEIFSFEHDLWSY